MQGRSFGNSEAYGNITFFMNLKGVSLESELAQICTVVNETTSSIEQERK
jgi:hypothetical protein